MSCIPTLLIYFLSCIPIARDTTTTYIHIASSELCHEIHPELHGYATTQIYPSFKTVGRYSPTAYKTTSPQTQPSSTHTAITTKMAPPSALVGKPPLTPDDATIIAGVQLLYVKGLKHPDPSKGLKLPVKPPPPGTPHEDLGGAQIAGAVIGAVLMLSFTVTRLVIRALHRNLKFGADDWAIIVALVRDNFPL